MFNSNFLSKMTKSRFNLRNVIAIATCLAVTTMFASCDKKNGDDDDGGTQTGKIDPKLVGEWENKLYYTPTVFDTYYCSFRNNGTFISSVIGSATSQGTLSGNYTVSNGWITLTNVVATRDAGILIDDWLKTYRVEYRFEKNPDGKNDYLNMCVLFYDNRAELPLDFAWARWTKK